jgi:hypothetical protein
MTIGYIGVGHGRTEKGTYDPGAIGKKPYRLIEHELAHHVCSSIVVGLKRSGITDLISESDSGVGHDPDFKGSTAKANASGAKWAIEVHFNAGGGTGSECWIYAKGGHAEKLAGAILGKLPKAIGLPLHGGVKVNPKFYFPHYTKMPAVIVEVAFVDGDNAKIGADVPNFCAAAGEAIAAGICAYSGVGFKPPATRPTPSQEPSKPKPAPESGLIMGSAELDAKRLSGWFASKKKKPRLQKVTVEQLIKLYLVEGGAERVRGDVAFTQACKETGYFTFGGDVRPEQNNFAGIGATGGGAHGASFPDAQTGVRAHIQHLKAYADPKVTKAKLAHPCVDPRFDAVSPKGKAKKWVDLNGKWAVPGKGYGEEILKLFAEAKAMK